MFFFPISKHKKLRKLPFVTFFLIIANVLIFYETWTPIRQNYAEQEKLQASKTNYESDFASLNVEIMNLFSEIEGMKNENPYDSSTPRYKGRGYDSAYFNRVQEWERRRNESIASRESVLAEKKERLAALENEMSNYESRLAEISGRNPLLKFGYVPSKRDYLQLLTYQFLHGGVLHLVFNMFFLWFAGSNLEDRWGKWFFLSFYLIGGVLAALVNNAVVSAGTLPLIGASGAIAACMGAFMIKYPAMKIKVVYAIFYKFGIADWPAWVFFIIWFFEQFWAGMLAVNYNVAGEVAYWAHIGGFAFGAFAAGMMKVFDIEERFLAGAVEKDERKLLSVNPRVLDAQDLIAEQKYKEAEALLRDVIKKEPNCPEAYRTLIELLLKYNTLKTDEVRELAVRLVESSCMKNLTTEVLLDYYKYRDDLRGRKLSVRCFLSLARLLDSKEDWTEAAYLCKELINNYPEDPLSAKAYFALGKYRIRQKDLQGVAEMFSTLLKKPEGIHYKDMIVAEIKKTYNETIEEFFLRQLP